MDIRIALLVAILTVLAIGTSEKCQRKSENDIVIGFLPLKTRPVWPIEEINRISKNWTSYIPLSGKNRTQLQSEYGSCYDVIYVNIRYPRKEWVYRDIDNKNALADLSVVDAVVGTYIPAIENYCKMNNKSYVLTLPPPVRVEDRMLKEEDDKRVMFSAWPSWQNFFETSIWSLKLSAHLINRDAGKAFRMRKSLGRVYIIVEGPDGELSAIANKLGTILTLERSPRVKPGADAVQVRMFNAPDSYSPYRYAVHKSLMGSIQEFDPDMVIFMYRQENGMQNQIANVLWFDNLYELLIATGRETKFYLWDMRTDFNGILSSFRTYEGYLTTDLIGLRSIGLFNVNPFNLPADNITTDLSELVGANDAASMVLRNAATVSDMDFNKDTLLGVLRKTKFSLAGVKSRDENRMAINSGSSFYKGFRVFAAVYLGLIAPNASFSSHSQKADPDDDISYSDFPDVFTNVKPKMEFFFSKYYDQDIGLVVGQTEPLDTGVKKRFKEDAIVAVLEEPFVSLARGETGEHRSGYVGLCPDLLDEAFVRMAKLTGHNHKYKIHHVEGNQYGSLDHKTNKWSGAFGDLQKQKAVMAIGMISKTVDRKRDFDFSPTYEFVGITFLVRKHFEHPGTFAFMMPFKLSVWWGLLAVMILSTVFIVILERWNPFIDKVEKNTRFNTKESMWYSFGTITMAGAEFAPIMFPTRVYSVFYWFFALVVTACYTGNLATFLVERQQTLPMDTVSSIPFKKGMKWGTLNGSYMDTFIKQQSLSSSDGTSEGYRLLARGLQYARNYGEGATVAMEGGFAFIGTSLLLRYHMAKDPDCNLAIGPHYESFTEIAFPIRRDWHGKHTFIEAMYSMRHDGTMRNLIRKWISKTQCAEADDEDEEDEDIHDIRLHFENFRGLFIVLGIFYAISYVVLFIKLGVLKLKERHHKSRRKEEDGAQPASKRGEDFPMIEDKNATVTTV